MTTPRTIIRLGFAALACAPLSVALGEGSELPDGSVTITSLPFFDTGDTSDNLDDYDAICPWASNSPDVFYAFTVPPDLLAFELELCRSGYDTKVFVLDEAFNVIACDDDSCDSKSGGGAYRSMLFCSAIPSGETIHIAIDGWSGDAGSYELIVTECAPEDLCIFGTTAWDGCPDGATDEAEPCLENVEDTTNGGCETTPARFTPIECGETVCGLLYKNDLMRDTDWFELATSVATEVTMTAIGESQLIIGRVEDSACTPGAPECSCISGEIDPSAATFRCQERDVISPVVAGRSWWFVTSFQTAAAPCGSELPGNDYIVSWNCAFSECCMLGDTNDDGAIDFNDLVILLANWGPCDG